MLKNIVIVAFVFVFSGIHVFGQTDAALKPSVITGDVVTVDKGKIVVNTKNGQIEAALTDKTEFKRVSPENPSLKTATPSAFAEVAVGDRLMVTGVLAPDGKSLPARAVYLMTRADISQKNAKETEQWRTRGVTGRVVSVDPLTNKINVEMRSLTGSSTIAVTPKGDAKFLRYAPDSVRYDEAKTSSLAEIKAGDMLRALGEKSGDGATFTAEQVLTGAFQTIAGTVKSVDVEKNEVVIHDLQSKKDVTVVISATSVLKRFPAEMAERMAGIQAGGVRPGGQGGATPPQGGAATPGATAGGPRPIGGPRPAGGIDDMLDRFPDIKAADLKAGDMIAISSTKNGTTDRIKAIKLVAGVEPFLRMAQATTGGQRPGQGVQGGFSIPGLEGIGF